MIYLKPYSGNLVKFEKRLLSLINIFLSIDLASRPVDTAQQLTMDCINTDCECSLRMDHKAYIKKMCVTVAVTVMTENLEISFPRNRILSVPDYTFFQRTVFKVV